MKENASDNLLQPETKQNLKKVIHFKIQGSVKNDRKFKKGWELILGEK